MLNHDVNKTCSSYVTVDLQRVANILWTFMNMLGHGDVRHALWPPAAKQQCFNYPI